ncbi:MAG: endonuclease/exonuclease/phosphatase family protein [Phycisphaerales bacterium]|nr:endonuclease/exonuclease/phosphatase family protein [Phycisphaerales bacterium]
MQRTLFCWITAVILAAPAWAQEQRAPFVLSPIAKLGPGAGKEISGIVASRSHPGVFWTLNDSGDEPRVYPVRIDGSVVPAVRYPQVPGTLIGGAINGDWEDIAVDASGRLIIADFGNNTNARRDLCLYIVPEPEPTEGRANALSKVLFRYPDQREFPAPESDFNFDAEALFTVGDDIFVLSKNRTDTFTKLYRLDSRDLGEVNTLTYVGRFDVRGECTGADASPDGLKLAILTYERVWVLQRPSTRVPFLAGSVLMREYRLPAGAADTESICFDADGSLIIADEQSGGMYRIPLDELDPISSGSAGAQEQSRDAMAEQRTRVMSFNIRYAGGDKGENSWARRAGLVRGRIADADPDILGLQEVEAVQADWLKRTFADRTYVGVGRIDADRAGEAAPILFRTERYALLGLGHFWLSPSPDEPGSRGWDAACERMATWLRLRDRVSGSVVFVLNTHLDHIGATARRESARLIRRKIDALHDGAEVIVLGDFNASADGDLQPLICTAVNRGGVTLTDTYRTLFPVPDALEATFCGWNGTIAGARIDWILVSPGFVVEAVDIDRRMHGTRTPSDHFPVISDLYWRGAEKP